MFLTIVGAPPPNPLHEGMWFAAARYNEVAMRLATLWVVMSFSRSVPAWAHGR
jgi:hypothetical protein